MLSDFDCAVRYLKMPFMVAGFQPEGGTTEPLADVLAQTVLGIGFIEVRMSSVNQDGLTGALRFSTRVVEFGSEVLTRLSGKWPGA